jgi:hypothetical protein
VPILLVSETSVGREPLEIVPSANQVSDYEMLRRQCDIISNENQSLKKVWKKHPVTYDVDVLEGPLFLLYFLRIKNGDNAGLSGVDRRA